MLQISNLSVSIDEKPIINSLSLSVPSGSVHAIMGLNGSGKSTLAFAVMGHPAYTITQGSMVLNGQIITDLSVEKRAQAGLFLAFQHP